MNEIIEYITALASNIKDLDKKVNDLIKQGYQPYGSPYVTEGTEFLACQAMVRHNIG